MSIKFYTNKTENLMRQIAAIVVTGITLGIASSVQAVVITFPDFSSPAGLIANPNGDASIVTGSGPGFIRLTEDGKTSQAGSAFLTTPPSISSTVDFSTTFTFQIIHETDPMRPLDTGSDGFAFIIQPSFPDSSFLGEAGGNIGYLSLSDGGATISRPYYAIEFDTHKNSIFGDTSDEHIALTRFFPGVLPVPGSTTDPTKPTTILQSVDKSFADGLEHSVTIDFSQRSQNERLRVLLDGKFVFSHDFDKASDFFPGGPTGLGFTAATGAGTATHRINSWSVEIPEPATILLLGVGLAAFAFGAKRGRRT